MQVAPTIAEPLNTRLHEFAAVGGLAVLPKHFPMFLCVSSAGVASESIYTGAAGPWYVFIVLRSTATAVPGVGNAQH